jgi:hypothetical protein
LNVTHPGIASVTQANWDAATGRYSQIVSVTNSTTQIVLDRDMRAPRSDTFSIGIDRQLASQLAINTSYVYKNGQDLIAWCDIGGVYGEGTTVLPDGRPLTVYRLLNAPSARLYQLTNLPESYDRYDGWVTSLSKRLSNRWQAQLNLTLSKSRGLRFSGTQGRDPNDLINAEGRLNPTDRPVMFSANGSYDIPVLDVRVSANYQNVSHTPRAPIASVTLPQGRRNINIEAPGSFRAERISVLYLRFNKFLRVGGHCRLELMANVVNALQNKAPSNNFITFNFFSPTYGVPSGWIQPRQLYLGMKSALLSGGGSGKQSASGIGMRASVAIVRVARRPGSGLQRCPAVPVGSGDRQWSRRSPRPSSQLVGCLRPRSRFA